ncbi:MAG: TatD family hydrolase [Eubacteriales bacterium]|nr:TatD family hydrolase [Eubacteriales bacterium]
MFFDTHAHLDDARFDEDREFIIESLNEKEIDFVTNIGCDMKSSYASYEMAQKYPFIYATVGVHPHSASEMTEEDLVQLEKWTQNEKVVAIGEIGLDYYYDFSPKDNQKYWFSKQLELAEKLDYPVVIHDRDAHEDCINLLKQFDVKGIFHCFSGSKEMAEIVVKMGFYVAFGGALTFKNSKKSVQAAKAVPLDRLLIETDCPYLAPEGFRGKRNDPSLVRYAAIKLAEIKDIPFEEMAKITTENAKRVYRI